MESMDGESCRGTGQPCPALLKLQGQQCAACGAGCGPLVGPVYAHLPPELQLEFKWFFNEVLAPAPPAGGTSPAVPHWKSVIIRAIGNMLHALMIFGVTYTVVTHAVQHNPDGSHKTIQAEGTTRREDGAKIEVETGKRKPDGDGNPQPEARVLHALGNFEYLTGFDDVWLNHQHYDLRAHKKARLCLEFLAIQRAVNAASARHFLEEIDPYVRETGGLGARGKFSEVKIQDYFREPTGQLVKLCQALIQAVDGTGKYYLATNAG